MKKEIAVKLIKEIREQSGLAQDAFAEKYGIPIGTLHHWEAGDRIPPEYVIDMLAKLQGLEKLMVKGWVFIEERDEAGTGTIEVFETEREALDYATKEWNHKSEADKESYQSGDTFLVGCVDMFWDEIGMEWAPDEGNVDVTQSWI